MITSVLPGNTGGIVGDLIVYYWPCPNIDDPKKEDLTNSTIYFKKYMYSKE